VLHWPQAAGGDPDRGPERLATASAASAGPEQLAATLSGWQTTQAAGGGPERLVKALSGRR
jgi:hypothetical protein